MITDSDEKIIDSVQLPPQQSEEIAEAIQSINNFFIENPERDSVRLFVIVERQESLLVPMIHSSCSITRSAAKIGLEEMLLLEVYSVRETIETVRRGRGIVRFRISLDCNVYDVQSSIREPDYVYDCDLSYDIRTDRYSQML